MTSEKYWDARATKRLTEVEKQSDEYIKRVKKIYVQANRDIKKQIANIYKNYSKETGLDIHTLKTLLSKNETDKFWKTLEGKGLKKYVQDNYKARINRLEQLQGQLYARAKEIYEEEFKTVYGHYRSIINESYNKTIYDTQIGLGYDFSFNKLDDKMIETVLNTKWYGANYSNRIWGNTEILANKLNETLGGALVSGKPYYKVTEEISETFEIAQYYAERLIRTESNHFNAEAEALAYEELGVEKYVFVATLDNRTSEMCQEHDGKVYYFKDKKTGVNYPPLHPNCRSTTRGYLGEEEEKMLKRRARNPTTGKTEIIDNISYKDWMKKYVTNEGKDAIISRNIPKDIKDFYQYVNESNSLNKLTEFGENENGVIRGQKLNEILGYDSKPTLVSKEKFEELATNSKLGKLYRGVSAESKEDAEKYVNEFKNGRLYAGKGVYGNGTYAAYGEKGLKLVNANYTNENGKVMTMLLDNDAKVVKYSEIFEMKQKELRELTNNDISNEFRMAILMNDGYYASIKGYDAIILDDVMAELNNQPYVVILNRGKVIMNENEL